MKHDTFFDRPRTPIATSMGTVELPAPFRDASAVHVFFRVDHLRAAALLASTPLVPARMLGGTALALLAFYDYPDTPVGPYREVATAIAAMPEGSPVPALPLVHLFRATAHSDIGFHVLDLPVTTELANVAGREIWGLPKFVTEIAVEVSEDHVRAVVAAPEGDEPIVALDGRPGPGVTLPAMDVVVYSELRGELLRTVVNARGRMHTGLGRSLVLRVGRGTHAMADRLVALGLDGARPLAAQVCTRYEMVLNAGAPVARARAA